MKWTAAEPLETTERRRPPRCGVPTNGLRRRTTGPQSAGGHTRRGPAKHSDPSETLLCCLRDRAPVRRGRESDECYGEPMRWAVVLWGLAMACGVKTEVDGSGSSSRPSASVRSASLAATSTSSSSSSTGGLVLRSDDAGTAGDGASTDALDDAAFTMVSTAFCPIAGASPTCPAVAGYPAPAPSSFTVGCDFTECTEGGACLDCTCTDAGAWECGPLPPCQCAPPK
jgi:hypothetical protein